MPPSFFYRGTSPDPSRVRATLRFYCGWMMGPAPPLSTGGHSPLKPLALSARDINLSDYDSDEMQYVCWPDGGYGETEAPFSGTAVGITSITFNFKESEEE